MSQQKVTRKRRTATNSSNLYFGVWVDGDDLKGRPTVIEKGGKESKVDGKQERKEDADGCQLGGTEVGRGEGK